MFIIHPKVRSKLQIKIYKVIFAELGRISICGFIASDKGCPSHEDYNQYMDGLNVE